MGDFNSSDEENDTPHDMTPFVIDWLDMSPYECPVDLAISALPGCRFKNTWRNIKTDIASIKAAEVTDVFVLCTKGELTKYRVPSLLTVYEESDITVHHHAFLDGLTPTVEAMDTMLDDLTECLKHKKRSLVHCFGGLGRSCLVAACLLLQLDPKLTPEEAIEKMRDLRGSSAVQSVKQFNFINEFRENSSELKKKKSDSDNRSVSR